MNHTINKKKEKQEEGTLLNICMMKCHPTQQRLWLFHIHSDNKLFPFLNECGFIKLFTLLIC